MARPRRLGLGDEVVVLLPGDGVERATEEVDNLLLKCVAVQKGGRVLLSNMYRLITTTFDTLLI